MKTYTFSQARQNFASVLDKAKDDGEVYINRKDGTSFVIKPIKKDSSPLDVEGIDISITSDEIVEVLREVRSR